MRRQGGGRRGRGACRSQRRPLRAACGVVGADSFVALDAGAVFSSPMRRIALAAIAARGLRGWPAAPANTAAAAAAALRSAAMASSTHDAREACRIHLKASRRELGPATAARANVAAARAGGRAGGDAPRTLLSLLCCANQPALVRCRTRCPRTQTLARSSPAFGCGRDVETVCEAAPLRRRCRCRCRRCPAQLQPPRCTHPCTLHPAPWPPHACTQASVNMSSQEMEAWLRTKESRRAVEETSDAADAQGRLVARRWAPDPAAEAWGPGPGATGSARGGSAAGLPAVS